jgi:hypothetical protein
MSDQVKDERPPKLRVAAVVVMDGAMLAKARAKAEEHGVPFSDYMERAARLYGKFLDKKVSVIARPI